MCDANYLHPEIREEIKSRLEAELELDLPVHRRLEVEAQLTSIKMFEDSETITATRGKTKGQHSA